MAKNLIMLIIISLLSKLLGFIREILLAYFYGVGEITDIYLMAISGSGFFLGWLGTFAVVHTPIYQEIKAKKNEKMSEQYSNQVNLAILLLGIVSTVIIYFFGTDMIHAVAQGFGKEKVCLTAEFFRWAAFSVVITSVSQIYISELNCKGKFVTANVTNCVMSLLQMVCILLSSIFHNFTILKYSSLASAVTQFLLLIIALTSVKHEFYIRFPIMKELKNTFILAIPIFISTLMDEINAFIDKVFGSHLPEGNISALNYAHLIKQLFFYIFATAMVTVIYPKFSQNLAENNKKDFRANIHIGMEYMIILFSIIMTVLVFFAKPIVEIIYKRGNFDNIAVETTRQALVMYSMALLPLAVREILIRIFQAMKDTKINMIVGGVSAVFNIILNCILIKPLGHRGLALSTAISAYLTVPLLFYYLVRKKVDIQIRETILLLAKTLFTAIIITGIFHLIFYSHILQIQNLWLKFLILGMEVIGICIFYFTGLFILRVDSIRMVVRKIKRKVE